MRLVIREHAEQAAQYIAEYIIDRINTHNATSSKPFVLGLPTGSSPIPIYNRLIAAHQAGRISFRNVITFNMDEYVGLDASHPQSYHAFMHAHFFAHVDVPPANINILSGTAADLDAECVAYEARMRAAGGVDLFLGGVGGDGHIAFNEPGSSLASRTRVKTLTYDTVLANARFFGGDVDAVPRMALTVGVQTIMEAREVVVVVTGAAKALALRRAVEGGVSHMCTLSCLQLHPRGLVVADEDATMELQVKTVKYFRGIEQTGTEEKQQAQQKLARLRTTSLITPQQSPDSKRADLDDVVLEDLTPDSMSSRMPFPPALPTPV